MEQAFAYISEQDLGFGIRPFLGAGLRDEYRRPYEPFIEMTWVKLSTINPFWSPQERDIG